MLLICPKNKECPVKQCFHRTSHIKNPDCKDYCGHLLENFTCVNDIKEERKQEIQKLNEI